MLDIQRHVSLKAYNTFGIDVSADCLVTIGSASELEELLASGMLRETPFFVVGGGSNLVFLDDFHGIIVHMAHAAVRAVEDAAWELSPDEMAVEAEAGLVWDDFVHHCIHHGWYGLENLVAIPGTVGASPVQNVGAYGVEAKDVILEVRAYEVGSGRLHTFSNAECHFAYRDSIFKGELKGRYIVSSVVFRLQRRFQPNLGYKAVAAAMEATGCAHPTAAQLAGAITDIRWSKLPRPEQLGSAGSFFKNPIVSADQHAALKQRFPDMVSYPLPNGDAKLAAGWLIEHSGWKGRSLGPVGVYEKQALVLVNLGGCKGSDVLRLAQAIVDEVYTRFGVTLEKEAIVV